jgi:hypothetical protein
MAEPRISLEDLEAFDLSKYRPEQPEDFDPRRRVARRRQHCLQHFLTFLAAPQMYAQKMHDLSAVNIPQELLTEQQWLTMDQMFRHLHNLDLQLGALPHSDWLSRGALQQVYVNGRSLAARRLRQLLDKSMDLQHLRLEFQSNIAEYSFEIFDQTNLDRFPRVFLQNLRSLELRKFTCSWNDLHGFLAEGRCLVSLRLSHCRLESGSMIDLIHFIPLMKLESVSIHGRWFVDEDAGEWHAHNAEDFTADCLANTTYEGPYLANGMKSKIEGFLLGNGECPLPRWTPQGGEEEIWEMKGDTSWHFVPGPFRLF